MTTTEWGDDLDAPPRRRPPIPGYVWIGAGGCLLLLAAALSAAILAWPRITSAIQGLADQERQWAAVSSWLPHQTPPSDLRVVRIPVLARTMGMDALWVLSSDSRDAVGFLCAGERAEAGEFRRRAMKPVARVRDAEMPTRYGLDKGTLEIDGRQVRFLRFQVQPEAGRVEDWEADPDEPEAPGDRAGFRFGAEEADGAGILLDLGPEEGPTAILLQLLKRESSEPWSDGEIEALLEPFDLGSVR